MIGRLRTWSSTAADMDAEARPQQLHLDVEVDDADEAELAVLALGATRLPDPSDAEDFRVFADPAGHPFCLVFDVD